MSSMKIEFYCIQMITIICFELTSKGKKCEHSFFFLLLRYGEMTNKRKKPIKTMTSRTYMKIFLTLQLKKIEIIFISNLTSDFLF
jgi:hypothetical protein